MSWITGLLKRPSSDSFESVLAEYNKTRLRKQNFTLCYAPFKALYFGHGGKVTTCCYNRLYQLGRWPQNQISDIWNGIAANELREELKMNSLHKGCASCETQLMARNFSAFKGAQFDLNPLNSNEYPSVFEFELDNTCNLECIMCSPQYSSSIANRLGIKKRDSVYNQQFIEQLEEFIPHLQQAKFYGGEPFMIPIYYSIWDKIAAINPKCQIDIQTNATQLNTRIKDILEKGMFNINVSLDSLERENYEKIRAGANFDNVMANLNYLHQYAKRKKTFLGVSVCVFKNNWHEIPRFIEFVNEREIPIYFHTVFNPRHLSLFTISPVEKQNILINYQSFNFNEPISGIQKENLHHFQGLINQIGAIRNEVEDSTFDTWDHLYSWIGEYAVRFEPALAPAAAQFVSQLKDVVYEMNLETDYRFPRSINISTFESQFKLLVGLSKEAFREVLENAPYY